MELTEMLYVPGVGDVGVRIHCLYLGGFVFSGHAATREPSTWWGRVLFTTRLEIAVWAPCLHTVVRVPLF
jgi:hypothetical protein